MRELNILHTSDLHGRLQTAPGERLAALRRDLGASGLLLDCGDAISSGNITFRPGGEPELTRMSDLGYDAMCVGNREFHFSRTGFSVKVRLARFPVLCANVRARGAFQPPVAGSLALERGGYRVGLIGLTVPMVTEQMRVRHLSSWVFDSPFERAAALVTEVRAGCDLLIVMTHLGVRRDMRLAETVPGIDLLLGGHSHTLMDRGGRVNGTLVLHSGAYGENVGRVRITGEPGRLTIDSEVAPL